MKNIFVSYIGFHYNTKKSKIKKITKRILTSLSPPLRTLISLPLPFTILQCLSPRVTIRQNSQHISKIPLIYLCRHVITHSPSYISHTLFIHTEKKKEKKRNTSPLSLSKSSHAQLSAHHPPHSQKNPLNSQLKP